MTEQITQLTYDLERKLCTVGFEMQQEIYQANLNGENFDYNAFLSKSIKNIDDAIENGVDINNFRDSSAIYCVLEGCVSAHFPLEITALRRDLITHLISRGADVNIGYFGSAGIISPMQIAEAERYNDIVELLEKHGAQIGSKNTKAKNDEQAIEKE